MSYYFTAPDILELEWNTVKIKVESRFCSKLVDAFSINLARKVIVIAKLEKTITFTCTIIECEIM